MADSEYTIRRYEPGDEQDFIDIFNRTWSAEKATDWFDWRYRDNPYIDEVPMYVAEYEGRVVATRPYKTYRVRSGDVERLAFHGVDSMTLPDHRRRGLFTRLNEATLDDYGSRPVDERPAFVFTHSNQYSMPGHRKMGVRYFSPMVRHNRVQRAGSYVLDRVGGPVGRVGGAAANALNRGFLRVLDRRVPFDTGRFTVERHDAVPAEVLGECYAACRPDTVHVVFDEAFHEWFFAEPGNPPDATYVVHWDGHPVAGVVTGRTYDERNDTTTTTIRHVVPAAGGPDRTAALAAAFEALLSDYSDADLIRTQLALVPDAVLDAFGFYPDDRLPMSKLADRAGLTFGLRPIPEGQWSLNGRPIDGAEATLWTVA